MYFGRSFLSDVVAVAEPSKMVAKKKKKKYEKRYPSKRVQARSEDISKSDISSISRHREVPIKYISFEYNGAKELASDNNQVAGKAKNFSQHLYSSTKWGLEGCSNKLILGILQRDWKSVSERLRTNDGIEEVRKKTNSDEFALHILCKCESNRTDCSTNTRLINNTNRKFPNQLSENISRSNTSHVSWNGTFISTLGSGAQSKNVGSTAETSSFTHSSSGATTSISTKDTVFARSNNNLAPLAKTSFPSLTLFKEVIEANVDAVKHNDASGSTPLHWAVRYAYPLEYINYLIHIFPRALDMRDNDMQTPRDYVLSFREEEYQSLDKVRSSILRPTCCWIQQLSDEKTQTLLEKELTRFENKIFVDLERALAKSEEEENILIKRLEMLEKKIAPLHGLDTVSKSDNSLGNMFLGKIAQMEKELENDLQMARIKLDGLVDKVNTKFSNDEKERSFLESFNEDVLRTYNASDRELEKLRERSHQLSLELGMEYPDRKEARNLRTTTRYERRNKEY